MVLFLSDSKLLADFRNVHVLYIWRSVLIATGHLRKKFENIINFFFFFNLTIKANLQTYKTCTFVESASNLLKEKSRGYCKPKLRSFRHSWNFYTFFKLNSHFCITKHPRAYALCSNSSEKESNHFIGKP
jgi:hypothetical protein